MTRYKLVVFQIYNDHEKVWDRRSKRFNSIWLRKAYMNALHKKYEGERFRSSLYLGNR